jgi:hypothetical protein
VLSAVLADLAGALPPPVLLRRWHAARAQLAATLAEVPA